MKTNTTDIAKARTGLVLRPCRAGDLDAVERVASASPIGIGSLPRDRWKLAEKIRLSSQSFSAEADTSGEEVYFFVLEDPVDGRIVGTSGIAASAGFGDRFYSYRNEFIVHASQEIRASNRIHSLHLCHDLTGATLLTSFYIDPELADTPWPRLLSRARLLFIAQHPERFADRIAAEMPGLCDDAGQSPFWNAVGRRFFNLGYPQAEQLAGGRSKSFIAELMPQYPIYVPLLQADAQLAIGQLHPAGELPFSILLEEGFEADTYVDVFDGGPTVEALAQRLATVQASRCVRAVPEKGSTAGSLHLATNTSTEDFRATIVQLSPSPRGDEVALDAAAFGALAVEPGDLLRIAPLNLKEG